MRRDDDAILLDIAHAARLVTKFVAGKDKGVFLADELMQSAVLHQILVLGEAAKRLSAEFRAAHPEVPWSDMACNCLMAPPEGSLAHVAATLGGP